MKKYLQISIVLGIFIVVFLVKELSKTQDKNILPIGRNNQSPTSVVEPTTAITSTPQNTGIYKDGTYTGDNVDAFYGNIQVQAVIANGKITKINFLDYPNTPGHTMEVSDISLPILEKEAIEIQNSNVDIVSGATQTSEGFQKSLASALEKAK